LPGLTEIPNVRVALLPPMSVKAVVDAWPIDACP
jgi:hypothetical protein